MHFFKNMYFSFKIVYVYAHKFNICYKSINAIMLCILDFTFFILWSFSSCFPSCFALYSFLLPLCLLHPNPHTQVTVYSQMFIYLHTHTHTHRFFFHYLFYKMKYHTWWSILCVNLVIPSVTNLAVVIKVHNQWLLVKENILDNLVGPHPFSWNALRVEPRFLGRRNSTCG